MACGISPTVILCHLWLAKQTTRRSACSEQSTEALLQPCSVLTSVALMNAHVVMCCSR